MLDKDWLRYKKRHPSHCTCHKCSRGHKWDCNCLSCEPNKPLDTSKLIEPSYESKFRLNTFKTSEQKHEYKENCECIFCIKQRPIEQHTSYCACGICWANRQKLKDSNLKKELNSRIVRNHIKESNSLDLPKISKSRRKDSNVKCLTGAIFFMIIGALFALLSQSYYTEGVNANIEKYQIESIINMVKTVELSENPTENSAEFSSHTVDIKPTPTAIPTATSIPNASFREIEILVYNFINARRENHNLPKLIRDTKIDKIARNHSLDMIARNYFDHESPSGQDASDRAKKANYSCRKDYITYYTEGLAENIYQGWTYDSTTYFYGIPRKNYISNAEIASGAVEGWMNSPGHRANILDKTYNKVGTGVAISTDGKVFITQNFC